MRFKIVLASSVLAAALAAVSSRVATVGAPPWKAGDDVERSASLTQDKIEYGPQKEMSGVYFTNFENSKFVECSGPADYDNWVKKEAEWVNCVPLACQDLQSRVQKLNESLKKWGYFNIVFVGRRSLHRSAKEFIGDTESKILVERILRLEKRTTP